MNIHHLAGLCALLASFASIGEALPDSSVAAAWRASSRLGYGPTPEQAQAAQPSALAWSMAQLEAARRASQLPAQIPAAWQMLTANQQKVSHNFQLEREARKMERDTVKKPAAPMRSDGAIESGDDPAHYSRKLSNEANAWRLASCSNPDLENPFLARMTEFWFNTFQCVQRQRQRAPLCEQLTSQCDSAPCAGQV